MFLFNTIAFEVIVILVITQNITLDFKNDPHSWVYLILTLLTSSTIIILDRINVIYVLKRNEENKILAITSPGAIKNLL
jgi:NADH:ubiquinone oxidoreductase subunit 6 (subunit J)